MQIINIKKDYGELSTLVLYHREFTAEPPTCLIHSKISCQICFKRGKNIGKDDYLANSARKNSSRRAKRMVLDYALANEFSQFFTLTFDTKLNDSFNYDHCKKLVSKWFNNQRRDSPDLSYVVVSEKHKSGRIHFHAIVNNYNGETERAVNPHNGRKIVKNGKQIWNLKGWKYGYSTMSTIENREATAYYLTKYLSKDFIEAFNKKRYWASRNLKKPTKTYNVDTDVVFTDFPPLFRKLHKTDHCYNYTLYRGAVPTRSKNEIKAFVKRAHYDMLNTH